MRFSEEDIQQGIQLKATPKIEAKEVEAGIQPSFLKKHRDIAVRENDLATLEVKIMANPEPRVRPLLKVVL